VDPSCHPLWLLLLFHCFDPDRETFDFSFEELERVHLANLQNIATSLNLAFATWLFWYYDRHNKHDLSDLDAFPILEVKAGVFPTLYFGCCDQRNTADRKDRIAFPILEAKARLEFGWESELE
jgi:hypothetical protein